MPGFLGGSSSGSSGAGGEITFPKEFVDPVTKLRVSNPQNLIDTDFEYGLQPTKWETVELINNTPSFFSKSGDTTIPGITAITTNAGTREITVKTSLEHGLAAGIPIQVTGTKSVTADGSYIINSIPNPTTFTYLCRDDQAITSSIEDLYSSIITGEFFQGSQLRVADSSGITTDGESISTLTVRTESTHGFGVRTPFYFLNLNSTISQEFQAANTAAKSFDASNSATAQTFDGSNTLSSIPVDWSNSASVGGANSTIDSVSTTANTITVAHGAENFAGLALGTPLYYSVSPTVGYFSTNPRGVVFLKTTNNLGEGTSTFQVSQVPDGDPINIEASLSGFFKIANQAKTFAGNNVNPDTQISIDIVVEQSFPFDGANDGFVGGQALPNTLATVTNYSGSLVSVSTTAGAGLSLYAGAMVRYSTSGSAASGLTNNTTYFIDQFFSTGTDTYSFTLKDLPNDESALTSISGGTGTQTFTQIGVSVDKDIIHVKDANFQLGDLVRYTFPENGEFSTEDSGDQKRFYFITTAYDVHNFKLSTQLFAPIIATGGTVLPDYTSQGRTYRAHQFTTVGSSNFVVTSEGSEGTVDYLIVGGGGGGGNARGTNWGSGGGGGAGGLLSGSSAVTAQSYPIVVGAGGTGGPNSGSNNSTNGQNSSFLGLTAVGGGRGGAANFAGSSGGSGGGPGYVNFTVSQGTTGQGSASGGSVSTPIGGGGGGAGGAGGSGSDSPRTGGFGGAGLRSSITGVSLFYAGGGGGGVYQGSATAIGGSGVGGNAGDHGTNNTTANRGKPGLVNTGSGGGGGSGQTDINSAGGGGDGGSGIVVVRYPLTPAVPFEPAQATGGTVTTTTIGGITYNVHSFTSVGTSTFQVTETGTYNEFEYLVVAGGGGGGGWGGGGGGGGVLDGVFQASSNESYPVVVGDGGANGTGAYSRGGNGGNSSVFGITTIGGGGGGAWSDQAAFNGGSGGGGAGIGAFGLGTSGQGFNGGASPGTLTSSNYRGHGGGGGAGQPGQAGNQGGGGTIGGKGGDGKVSAITGTTAYYGGGGGGHSPGQSESNTRALGGLGGGGRGGRYVNPLITADNGQPNTGGGGGGGRGDSALPQDGIGRGGSGVVIIRYPIAVAQA